MRVVIAPTTLRKSQLQNPGYISDSITVDSGAHLDGLLHRITMKWKAPFLSSTLIPIYV